MFILFLYYQVAVNTLGHVILEQCNTLMCITPLATSQCPPDIPSVYKPLK